MKRDYLDDFDKVSEEFNKNLQIVNEKLLQINKSLKKTCDITGATQRAESIREEIRTKGWLTILKLYSSNINKHDPAAKELFEFYKYIYDDMVAKGEL